MGDRTECFDCGTPFSDDWKDGCWYCSILELQARGLSRSFEDVVKENKELQDQLLKVTNEKRALLDPSGELLPPLKAAGDK